MFDKKSGVTDNDSRASHCSFTAYFRSLLRTSFIDLLLINLVAFHGLTIRHITSTYWPVNKKHLIMLANVVSVVVVVVVVVVVIVVVVVVVVHYNRLSHSHSVML